MMATAFEIRLDGNHIQSIDDLFAAMSSAVGFELTPNFDALDEDLSSEIPLRCGPFSVIWEHADQSDWSGYQQLSKALGVLFYAQQRYPELFLSLKLRFDPEFNEDTWTFPEMFSSDYYRDERRKRGIND
jgi:RNAse (barnase) inhibitor barstar